MDQFRMLPLLRLPKGPVAIWYHEGQVQEGRLRWLGERLNSMAAVDNANVDNAVFVYGDGAVAWFDRTSLHYLGPNIVLPGRHPRPDSFSIASFIHQRSAAEKSLRKAINDLRRSPETEVRACG
jgi:hypothetical protein